MFKIFYPTLYVQSVYDIDYSVLYKEGKRFLIFDVDNTLAPFDTPLPPKEVTALMGDLARMGFKVCLLSNNKGKRVEIFNQELGLFTVGRAGKPRRGGLMKALRLMGGEPSGAVLIGDQLFTDVLCANRCAVYSILVKPISKRDEWTVRLKRAPEKLVMKYYLKYLKKANG